MVSTVPAIEGTDKSKDIYFTAPLKSGHIYIKDIYYSNTLKKPVMSISIPVFSREQDSEYITNILVARIDLQQSLYGLFLDRTGMGATGETLIVNKDVVALNELR